MNKSVYYSFNMKCTNCSRIFVKYVLFFFNLVIALMGIAMIVIGVALHFNWTAITIGLTANIPVAPWIFIIFGAVTFVIAFFGCCGAIYESRCMVIMYATFLFLIMAYEVIVVVALVFIYGSSIPTKLAKYLNDKGTPGSSVDNSTELLIDSLQLQFACCGMNSPKDYGSALTLPDSCCKPVNTPDTVAGNCTLNDTNPGCAPTIKSMYEIFVGVAIAITSIEIIGALFAICLSGAIRRMETGNYDTDRMDSKDSYSSGATKEFQLMTRRHYTRN